MFAGRVARVFFSVFLAAMIFSLWPPAPLMCEEEPEVPEVGDKAVDFELQVFGSGAKFKLEDVLGKKVVVLAFMQTSCVACRNELVLLRDILKKKGADSLAVYPVCVDYDASERIKPYKDFYKLTFPFLMDPEFSVGPLYGYTYTPALVIIDRDGNVAMKMSGFHEGDEVKVQKKIDSLLPEIAETE